MWGTLSTNHIKFDQELWQIQKLAAHLAPSYGTPVCRGTPVGNHWSRELSNLADHQWSTDNQTLGINVVVVCEIDKHILLSKAVSVITSKISVMLATLMG